MKLVIPVLAKDAKAFKSYVENEMNIKKPKTFWINPQRADIGDERYIYASDIDILRGLKFKSFVSIGAAFLHPKHKEILEYILREAQLTKSEES